MSSQRDNVTDQKPESGWDFLVAFALMAATLIVLLFALIPATRWVGNRGMQKMIIGTISGTSAITVFPYAVIGLSGKRRIPLRPHAMPVWFGGWYPTIVCQSVYMAYPTFLPIVVSGVVSLVVGILVGLDFRRRILRRNG